MVEPSPATPVPEDVVRTVITLAESSKKTSLEGDPSVRMSLHVSGGPLSGPSDVHVSLGTDAMTHEELLRHFQEIKGRYDKLAALKETKAEELFALYRASTEERFKASERLIETLKGEVEHLKTNLTKADDKLAHQPEKKSTTQTTSDEGQLLLATMTGTRIVQKTDSAGQSYWHCIQTGHPSYGKNRVM